MIDPFYIKLFKFAEKAQKTGESLKIINKRAVPLHNREQYDQELKTAKEDLLAFKRLARNFEHDIEVELKKWRNL